MLTLSLIGADVLEENVNKLAGGWPVYLAHCHCLTGINNHSVL
jgi:hypothetical protein